MSTGLRQIEVVELNEKAAGVGGFALGCNSPNGVSLNTELLIDESNLIAPQSLKLWFLMFGFSRYIFLQFRFEVIEFFNQLLFISKPVR